MVGFYLFLRAMVRVRSTRSITVQIRRILRVVAVCAGVLIVLLVAILAFLHTRTAKNLAIEQIRKFLAGQDIAIEAADFDYSFRPIRISTGRISIHKISTPDLPRLFSADHFTTSIRLYDLIHGRYHIEDLQIDNPSIHIVIDEKHRDNIPVASGSNSSSNQPIDWLILKLRSTGGSLTFEDRSQNTFAQVPVWDLSMDGNASNITEAFQFKTRETIQVRYSGKSLAIENIAVQGVLNPRKQTLDLGSVQISNDMGDIALNGNISNFSDPNLDLSAVSNLHVKPLRQFLSITQSIMGDLRMEGSIKGHPKELRIAGHLMGRNLGDKSRDTALDTDLDVDLRTNRARLTSILIRSPLLSASGAADLAIATDAGESRVDGNIDITDLRKLSTIYKLPVSIASRVSGNARGSWPAMDLGKLNGSGRFELFARPSPAGTDIPVAGVVNVTARGDALMASIESVDSGVIHLSGQLNLQALKRLDGSLRIDTSNAGQALTQVAGWSGSSVPATLQLSGPAVIDANLSGTLDRPQIDANLEASDLHVNDLKNINLNASAQYTREQIDVENLSLQWGAESATGSGRIGLTTPDSTLDGQVSLANTSMRRVFAALGRSEIPADGNIDAAATVSGTIQNPIVKAKLAASNLEAFGEALGTLSAEASLQNQIGQLDALTLNKTGGGELQATGRYEIASGSYVVDMKGNELHLNHVTLRQGTAISGDLNVDASGSGTVGNPAGILKLRARDLHIDTRNVGSIDLDADLADHLARITAGAPFYGIKANASVGAVRPYSAEVELHIDDTDISHIPSEQLKELSGHVTADVKATGDLSDIKGAVVQADIPALKLSWRNHAIANDGSVKLQYSNQEVTISQASIRFDESTARFSGNIPLEGSDGQLKLEGRANLADLATLIPADTPLRAQGQLVLNGSIRGNLKRIDPDLTLTITDASVETSAIPAPLQETNLMAVARNGHVVLERLTGKLGGAKLDAQGEASFALLPGLPIEIPRPDTPVRLSVDVEKFTLSSMTQPPPNTDGTISLKIDAQAPKADLNTAQIKVTFPDLQFKAGIFSLEQVGISSIEIRDGIASVQQFELKGPQTSIQLSGTADLHNSGPVDVKFKADSDTAVLALFSNAARVTGAAHVNVAVSGTVRQPKVDGFVEIQDGQAQIDNPRIAAENVQMRLDLEGNAINVTRLDGTLNGGAIKGEGRLNIFGDQRGNGQLSLSGDGIYVEFPKGVKTVSNAQLRIDGAYPNLTLSGNIDIEEGAYTDPLIIGRGLMSYFSNDQRTVTVADKSSGVKNTKLNVVLRTISPIDVNNNIARGNITAQLRLLGTIDQPGLTGRIDVEEGGRLTLSERKYSVDRGVITFTNEHDVEPVLDVIATTTVSVSDKAANKTTPYDITMQLSGAVTRKLDTVFTSNPPLDEGDIVSVLATGRKRSDATSSSGDVAKEQVLSYLAGNLGTSLTSEAGRAIGLSQVQIEPELISQEEDPTARLTIGQDITPKLNLVYSMNLRNSSDQIWIVNYEITHRFTTSGLRQDDNTYRFQLQHDVMFGLPGASSKTTPRVLRKIGSIQFSGDTHLTPEQLSNAADLKSGKSYDFFSVQNARDRIGKTLADDDRLEARISVEKKTAGSNVDIVFRIKEGPQVQLAFVGWDLSNKLKSDVRKAWSEGVIDAQRIADAVDIIESELIKERYFGFHVDTAIDNPNNDSREVTFTIQPGRKYNDLQFVFSGNHAIEVAQLQKLVKDGGFFDHGPKERDQAIPTIENAFKERGYIDVKVEPPRMQLDEEAGTAKAVFLVTEGGLYHFGNIYFEGNSEFPDEDLARRIKIGSEAVFQLATVTKAQQTLQELYRKTGYSDSTILYSQTKKVSVKAVDVTFNIQEGRQRIVKEIQVEGNQKTSRGLIRSQMALEPGDILGDDKLSQARSNLYAVGSYAFVEIEVIPVEDQAGYKPNQIPVRLVTHVREIPPWELNYGGFYDTERGLGVIADLSNRNMLGNGRIAGFQARYDSELREGRFYFSQPVVRRFPVKALFSAVKSNEKQTDNTTGRTTVTDKKSITPTFEYRFHKSNTLTLGYKLERTHEYSVVPDPLFPEAIARTAPLTTSFTRDIRDDPFDATTGYFTSHAVDWGTAALGSDLHYFKYFGQYFDYLKFGKPTIVPWIQKPRNRLLLALGARVGILKKEPGQDFRTEQFKTGGGTTVRGFDQDRLGPLDAGGNPTGGDAVLILNSELRFPAYKFIDGVAFVDAGNVYPTLQDFSPFDIRPSYGFGIRVRTPYLILRFDFGIKMKPKPNEPGSKFFFSIGQAF
jgi:outer membrane protein assembly complex protein YaeT